jgi:hypothetical protein
MAYTDEVSPQKVQEAVNRGFKRLSNFRNARVMFIRNYTGQYYDRTVGEIGTEPLSLIFNAIRVLIPNIVMSFPKHVLSTPYLAAKNYADCSADARPARASRSTFATCTAGASWTPCSRSACEDGTRPERDRVRSG